MSPLTALLQTLFPTTCAACGHVLAAGERQLCLHCLSGLDATALAPMTYQTPLHLLSGRMLLADALSLYRFEREGAVRRVVHAMKFRGNSELCLLMGRQLGLRLLQSGRFDDVDVLVPVPLHWWRRLQRGYNQSELLCRGIAEVFARPVVTGAVVRHRYTRQQSLQKASRRVANVEGAFSMRHPERLAGRHVLLVDDVLTTGATLGACADALGSVDGLRLSVATLCIVR